MKVNITSSKGLESNLTVLVTKKEIEQRIDERLNEVKSSINLKGFRPGKAPRQLLKKQFGQALYAEVIEKTLQQSTFKALEEKKIKPASQPKIDIKSSGEGKDLEFTIKVEKVPEIKNIIFDKIKIKKYKIKAEKKEIDQRLEYLADSAKKYKEKNTEAKDGDLIEFDYEAKVEGKPFEGNKGEKLQIILGKDLFIKGFDKQLLNSKKNEEKKVKVKLPENYPKKEIANKDAEFICKILNIKSAEKPVIDNDFAKSMGAKDLKDLESILDNQISKEYSAVTDQIVRKEILDQLDQEYKIDLPQGMLEEEVKGIEHSFVHEEMHEKGIKDHDKIVLDDKKKKEAKKLAERRVKLALILNKIGDDNKIEVSPQELQGELEKQLRMYPGQEKIIKDYYIKNPNELTKLRGPVYEEKVMKLIMQKCKSEVKILSKSEFQKLLEKEENTNKQSQSKNIKSKK